MQENIATAAPAIGNYLRSCRIKNGFTRTKAANMLGICTKTLQRIETTGGVQLNILQQMISLYGIPLFDLIQILTDTLLEEQPSTQEEYDNSPTHLARLEKYSEKDYRFYYYRTQENSQALTCMDVSFFAVNKNGYLPGFATVDGYTYDCKLVSPSSNHYSYIYLSSVGNNVTGERAIVLLHFSTQIKRKFLGGIGLILSLSRGNSSYPCYQRVAVLNADCNALPNLSTTLQRFLCMNVVSTDGTPTSVTKVYEDSIIGDDQNFYQEIVQNDKN